MTRLLALGIVLASAAIAASFEVASVKVSGRTVGPDYNNQVTIRPNGMTARNVTLQRLIADAYRVQLRQIVGPAWLAQAEYDVEAKSGAATSRDGFSAMLRELLVQRFMLRSHEEHREMRVYELVAGPEGLKTGSGNFHFRGEMRDFADLLAVQLTIPAPPGDPTQPARASGSPVPVLDRTAIEGVREFRVTMQPEPGTDMFTQWQRALREQLGLRLESRRDRVKVIVVDAASRVPTEN